MLSTDLTEFIRSVPIALSLTDQNETERNERIKPGWDTEMDNRTTETSEQFRAVFRRTWTDTEELLKEKSFFILSFVFLSEFVIRQVQTNIY